MMTRLPPYFYLLFFACAGVGLLYYGVSASVDEHKTPAQAVAQVTARQTATATGTATPVPTVDYSAVYPAQTQAAAVAELAAAHERVARAAVTIAAATSVAIDNAVRVGTPTAVAIMTAHALWTEQARATTEAGQRAAYFAGVSATMAAKADAEQRAANRADALFYAATLTVGMVALGATITFSWVAAYRANLAAWRRAAEHTADDVLSNLQPTFIQVGDGSYHSASVPVSDAKFRVWAEAMLAGETAGINKWETAESPFGRAGYAPFLAWAEERGYVEMVGGAKVLTEKGRAFCEAWLERRAAYPPINRGDRQPSQDTMNHIMPYPTGSVGEGIEDEN